jgi:hypothetical protein
LIDDKTLLQTDAMVIAGILILLTILLTVKPFEKPKGRKQRILRWLVVLAFIGPIWLFSISAIYTFYESVLEIAHFCAVLGFVWLMAAVGAIGWVFLVGVKEKTSTGGWGRDGALKDSKE